MYSDKVLDHFTNPRNVGYFEDADGMAQIGDPSCGDYLLFFLRINDGRVTGARFLCRGCLAAIACASVTTELVIGRPLEDLWDITDETIVEALDGLPEEKLHCSNLGALALEIALADYFSRRNKSGMPSEGQQQEHGDDEPSDSGA